ncbi:MAG: 50S ribosomal protein L24 [Deltaproteobacteria bacterium]|nr:50S ribosomal protein L24 [Deltaproteobacteria bacterium]
MRIRKGDEVVVTAGKDVGKRGKVLHVDPAKGRVKVEKINLIKRHVRPSQKHPQGGIVEKEGTLHISNVQIWDSKAQKGTRIGIRVLDGGKKVRVSRKTGDILD